MSSKLSPIISCGHCYNVAPMVIKGKADDEIYTEIDPGPGFTEGQYYEILKCPNCSKINLAKYYWDDFMTDPLESNYQIIYPQNSKFPEGMPPHILKAYEAADRIKSIDPGIYAISLRKVLELVCQDKSAKGKTLALMVKDLANRGELPNNLVKVANGLKNFGNVGAHAGIGDLSTKEIPIAEALCRAILEYIYSAPHLANVAENKLNAIKSKALKP